MARNLHRTLSPQPGYDISPAPWACRDDLTIEDAAGRAVCVMGNPMEGAIEQDVTNAAAILRTPHLIAALRGLIAIRPTNWADDDDPDQAAAWAYAEAALGVVGIKAATLTQCASHPDRRSITNLDGDDLCGDCANAWARGEGDHAAWLDAEDARVAATGAGT